MSCVPEAYMSQSKVEKIVLEALRDNLQTRKVSLEIASFLVLLFAMFKFEDSKLNTHRDSIDLQYQECAASEPTLQ